MSNLVVNPEDRFSCVVTKMRFSVLVSQIFSQAQLKCIYHYENMATQCTDFFCSSKNGEFHQKKKKIFLIFLLIFLLKTFIVGYTLEQPQRGNICITLYLPVLLYKSGVQGGIHVMDMLS